MNKKTKGIAILISLIVVGGSVWLILAGSKPLMDSMHANMHDSRERPNVSATNKGALQKLSKELGLTADQQAKAETLTDEMHKEMVSIQTDGRLSDEEKKKKAGDVFKKGKEQIEAMLTPEQVKRFEEIVKIEMSKQHATGH